MSENNNTDSGKFVLLLVVIVALMLCVAVYFLLGADYIPSPIVATNPTIIEIPAITPFPTITEVPTITPFPIVTDTPVIAIFPPTVVEPISVLKWHDDSSNCYSENNDKWVLVSGVEISGGIPSYKFKFEQLGQVLATTTVYPNDKGVKFDSSILVNKGAYVQVTINSSTQTGVPAWDSGLYYKLNPICDH